MQKNSKRLLAVAVTTALGMPVAAFATNGMNLEGYGPIATGMGGASMAYDNGTAAMMNNPATLGLMSEGNRLDVALGKLGPDVKASANTPMGSMSWSSSADTFYMPAIGWAKKSGKLTYGIGAFAQGGMGTQYDGGGPGTAFTQMAIQGAGRDPSVVSSWRERSEVGVMRVLVPLAYDVNKSLTVGGSIDYVRATVDLQMAMPGQIMSGMMMAGLISTNLTLPPTVYGGYFDFSDNNDYDGKTSGDGFAAKMGFTYKVNPALTVGGVYHSETNLSDLSGSGTMEVAYDTGTAAATMPVSGNIKIKNFQWPQTYGLGVSYAPNDKWMVAADVKQIQWSEVMKNFKMSFTTAGGGYLDATLPQNWKDQTVFELGGSYAVNSALTVRAGVNLSDNPIPDSTVNYLFPAIIKDHYSAGFGYAFNKVSSVNFALSYAPKVSVTGSGPANNGLKVSHSQTNWQVMYSHRF